VPSITVIGRRNGITLLLRSKKGHDAPADAEGDAAAARTMTVAQERLEHVLFVRFDRHAAGEVVLVGGNRHSARKTNAPLQRQTDASKSSHSRSDLYWPE